MYSEIKTASTGDLILGELRSIFVALYANDLQVQVFAPSNGTGLLRMPLKNGKLNRQEQVFSANYARTGDATFSAKKAGYASPAPRASQNLAKPAIQAEIIKHQQQILVAELLPASTAVLAAMLDMNTAGVPWSARAQAAKIVRSEVAGMADSKGAKDFADMSAEEIHQQIEEARRLLAERSKPVVEHVDEAPEPGAFG